MRYPTAVVAAFLAVWTVPPAAAEGSYEAEGWAAAAGAVWMARLLRDPGAVAGDFVFDMAILDAATGRVVDAARFRGLDNYVPAPGDDASVNLAYHAFSDDAAVAFHLGGAQVGASVAARGFFEEYQLVVGPPAPAP